MKKQTVPALDALAAYRPWVDVVRTYQKCHQLLSRRLATLSLTTAAHEVLLAVHRQQGIAQQTLARRLLVAKSNITGLLNRLEARGLVERRVDAADGRSRRIWLTPAGEALLAKSIACQADVIELMAGGHSEKELQVLTKMMRSAAERLDAAIADCADD